MENPSLYRHTLRTDRETIGFQSLPLLETRADRQRRAAARTRMTWFGAGAACTFVALIALAVLF